jgi:hypothetical protein
MQSIHNAERVRKLSLEVTKLERNNEAKQKTRGDTQILREIDKDIEMMNQHKEAIKAAI